MSDDFWKFRCRKSARRCGAKHISKSKCTNTPGSDHFGSSDVEKVNAVVARSAFPSQNVQNTSASDNFWTLRCRKSARRCGAKHIWKATTACTFSTSQLPKLVRTWCVLCIFTSKCASRHNGVHFFDISTAKSGPELVCFVHFDFKMCFAQNVKNTRGSDHFWRLRSRRAWQAHEIVDLVKSEQNMRILQHFDKRRQAWCKDAFSVAGAVL